MKVRFYCDVPSNGIRWMPGTPGQWVLMATTSPHTSMTGYTRVAFDVDMPPDLVVHPSDVSAPARAAEVVDNGGSE